MCNVNIATGEVTQFEFDVLLSGRIPWQLNRRYSSDNPGPSLIGYGWKLNLGTFLLCRGEQIEMVVDGEPLAQLPFLRVGERRPADASGIVAEQIDKGILITDSSDNKYAFPCREELPNVIPCAARYDHYRNSIEYRYDDKQRLHTLTDTFNRHICFDYDFRSRLVEVYVPLVDGRSTRWSLVRYEYDHQDDLVAVLDPNGNATRYEYSSHLLTRVTDPCGRDLYYQYDRHKQCIRTWFTGGVWDRQLSYDPHRLRVLVTHPDGHSKLFKHNEQGIVFGDIDPLGRVREDVLDANGRLLLRGGAGGGTQTVILRDPGSSTVMMSRNGTQSIFEVDANDQVTLMKKPDGCVWKYEYDRGGNETRSEAPDGAVWKFDYNEHGDLVRSVDPIGYERYRERSVDGLTLRDDWGVRLDERFDYFGRSIRVIDGEGGEIHFQYDASGQPLRRINPDGTSSSMEYDPSGRPRMLTDELGSQLRLVRDPADTSITFLRPDGHEEVFEYGPMDELRRITNSKGETGEFTYDAAGRCIAITYFDGRQHLIVYDDSDNPIAILDGRTGKVLAECKYENDLLVEESYYDGRRLRIEHGLSGEVVSVENTDATLSYERDALMRITVVRVDGLELRYAYNTRGDCTRLTVNTGRTIEYQWDGRRRLVMMVDSSAGTYEYSYDARDLVIEIRMPNGCSQHFQYDQRHRMTSRRVTRPDGSEICAREFSYDACGRLTGYRDSLRGTRTYTYDVMDSLTSVNDNGIVTRFAHDSDGNLLTTGAGDFVTYAAGGRPIRVGSEELEYDDRGNVNLWRSRDGESHFEYTGEGWLKRSVLANGTMAEYEYDGTARRTAKTVNGRRTEFDWNGVHLLSERTSDQAIEYLFMPGSLFLTGLTCGDRHYSYVCDQLGTPTELIDDAGEIAWAADYAAHGEITAVRVNKVSQPFRFLGQYCDEELAWHYNRYRYYHQVLGRFTCPDPLGFAAGINLYRYAPNPVNWVDPFGLAFASPGVGGTATCEVLSKCDWGPEMMKEARKKVAGVNEAGCDAIVTGPCDRPPDQKDFYMKTCVDEDDKAKVEASLKSQSDSCKSKQVDHIKEVQCGGINECDNLAPLVQTVNGSFGSQIKRCRDQLAAPPHNLTGVVSMTIKLVSIRGASAAALKRHDREPCESNKTRCP